ncbi:MAG: APC family permease [Bacilli bacterium]
MKEKKAGLPLAISMIVGTVVGSGIFFKSDDVLSKVNGNFKFAIMAWCVGAIAMIFGALVIAIYASKVSNANGMVDYFEYTFGKVSKRFGEMCGYLVGWYSSILFYPSLAAVVSWVAAMYTATLFGKEDPVNGTFTWILAASYLVSIFLIATFSRLISRYIQVSSVVLKLIPLFIMAIVGVVVGMSNGVDFGDVSSNLSGSSASFTGAVIATAFSFDGWIVATAINDELKNPKKDLPKALFLGTVLIFVIYVLYFVGVVATVGVDTVISEGDQAINIAFESLFGKNASVILIVFIVISCLGTTNGLIMASSRVSYQIALRGNGIAPSIMSKVNEKTKTPILSSAAGLGITLIMLTIWFSNFNPDILFDRFIDISSLPIVLNYIFFSILYIAAMFQFRDLSIVKRFIFPLLALSGASLIIYGGFIDESIFLYLIISLIIILCALPFFRKDKSV